jgi:hypothetical protein
MIRSSFIHGTGYEYSDLPGLGNNNEKLGLPERPSNGIQFDEHFSAPLAIFLHKQIYM